MGPTDANGWRLATGLLAAVLLVAAVVPPGDSVGRPGPLGFGVDLWLHAVGYGLFAALVRGGLADRSRPALASVLAAAAALGYGSLTEAVQAPLPYRSASLVDLAADGVGVAVALGLWVALAGVRAARTQVL